MRISRMRLEGDEENGWQNIPVAAFSIMTVYSGRVETMVDGQAIVREAGDYWSVKAGSVLKEKVLGESAILQIVAIEK
jgi:quercetin dioxygenase-like cupin family protein